MLRMPPARPHHRRTLPGIGNRSNVSASSPALRFPVSFDRRRKSLVVAATPSSSPPPPPPDFNALQTRLLRAIEQEDYAEAARARDALRQASTGGDESNALEALLPAWSDLPLSCSNDSPSQKKTPHWLSQRAEQLGYLYPTIVQRKAYEALSSPGRDAVVVAPTGSGKTLAFLMPLLSRLDYDDDESSSSPPSSEGNSIKRIKPVQLVVVVPTRDLGVQIALLIYKLFGGSVSKRVPGARDNMFSFTGPRGLSVRGVLDEGEALRARVGGGLKGATVVVGTPDLLLEACPRPDERETGRDERTAGDEIFPLGSTSVCVAVDEADACVDLHGDCLSRFLLAAMGAAVLNGRRRPDVVLVGASAVSGGALRAGIEGGWLRKDASRVVVGAEVEGVEEQRRPSPLDHLPRIPSSIKHRICVVGSVADALPTLARLLRRDAAEAGPDAAAPRTIVFARDEAAAKVAATALRASLWGVHSLAVLLPGGREPVRAAHAFRDGAASLLVATPRAARGLDLPAVDAVYCLGPPEAAASVSSTASTASSGEDDDGDGEADAGSAALARAAADYLHKAGRAGRLGAALESNGGGDADGSSAVVTSVVVAGGPEEEALREVSAALGVELEEVEAPAPPSELLLRESKPDEGEEGPAERATAEARTADVGEAAAADEALRRGLEDIFWTREAPEPGPSAGGGSGDNDDDGGALDNEE